MPAKENIIDLYEISHPKSAVVVEELLLLTIFSNIRNISKFITPKLVPYLSCITKV
jgi:hypothetical protein